MFSLRVRAAGWAGGSFSARLFVLRRRCPTDGITSRCVAPQDLILLVTITRGIDRVVGRFQQPSPGSNGSRSTASLILME